jgi:hypothetical protein
MALDVQALATVQELKDELESPTNSPRLDVRLEGLLNRASSVLSDYCARIFMDDGTPIVEYHSIVEGLLELYPLKWPVTSVVTLHEDPNQGYGAATLLPSTDYIVIPGSATERAKIIRTFQTPWLNGYRFQRLFYRGGFVNNAAKSNVPGGLKDVCLSLAALRWREIERKAQGEVVKSDVSGATMRFMDRSLTTAHLTDEMKDQLQPYRSEAYMPSGEAA